MSAVPFGDVYKPVKDFFGKFYNTSSLSLEGKIKPSGQFAFNPKINQSQDGSIASDLEFEANDQCKFCKTTGKLNITGDGKLKVELKSKELRSVPGLTLTGVAEVHSLENGKDAYEGQLEYKRASAANGEFLLNWKKRLAAGTLGCEVSTVLAPRKSTLLGATASFKPDFSVKDYTFAGSYKTGSALFAFTLDKSCALKFGTIVNTPQQVTFGSEAVVGPKDLAITVGAQTNISNVIWRSKLNNKGVVAFSAQTKLTDNITALLSTEVDLKKSVASKLGLKIEWAN